MDGDEEVKKEGTEGESTTASEETTSATEGEGDSKEGEDQAE